MGARTGTNEGQRGRKKRWERGALQQARKGFSGEKRGHFTPPRGRKRGRKEGAKGQKNCISLRHKAVRFGGELWRESAVLFL